MTDPNPALNTLLQAAHVLQTQTGDRPPARDMVAALARTEQHCKQQRMAYPAHDLLGTWRFSFGANRKSRITANGIQGRGFYVPGWIRATISFEQISLSEESKESAANDDNNDNQGAGEQAASTSVAMTVTNRLQMGAIALKLTGPAKYLNRKNLLAFDFHQFEIFALGKRVWTAPFSGRRSDSDTFESQSIATLPFFSFIAVTDDCIAARGRGGGLALWVKV